MAKSKPAFFSILQNSLGIILLIALIACAFFLHHQLNLFVQKGTHASVVEVTIEKGFGANKTAWTLKRKKVITDALFFRMMTVALGMTNDIKAGHYRIAPHASNFDILKQITQGKQEFLRLTIPEGITLYEARAIINNAPFLKGEMTLELTEGALLPETYFYERGMSRNQLARLMHEKIQEVLTLEWQNRQKDLPLATPFEALILASIIEKETAQADERQLVAGVFINRLRRDMLLQTDPTVIYGVTQGKSSSLNRPIRMSDLERHTPWNSYKVKGLPPTPICLPSRASIHAALHPADTDMLYFVADGSGGHAFAKTLKEHEDNVKNWRRIEADIRNQERIRQQAKDLKGALRPRPMRNDRRHSKPKPKKPKSTSSNAKTFYAR